MTAELALLTQPCGRCRKTIPVDAPLYRVTSARLIRCESCARQMVIGPLENPYPETVAEPRQWQEPHEHETMYRPTVPAVVLNALHDARMRQAGDREPGEDG